MEKLNEEEFKEEKYSNEKITEPEKVFEALVFQKITEDYKNDLLEVGFDDEQVFEFLMAITEYKHEDRGKIMSAPYELRKKTLKYYFGEVMFKKMTIKEMVKDMYETADENNFCLGYHTSPFEIKKEIKTKVKNEKVEAWDVKGSENDHRDDDVRMAYYSRDFENVYNHRQFEHIYIIRGRETDKNDTKWYRAQTLSIISSIDMNSGELQQWFLEYQNKKEQEEKEEENLFGESSIDREAS